MNQQIQDFARQELKTGLAKLPESNQLLFKRMYSHANLDASIDDAVDNMPEDKLDWAMQQVERTLEKQRNKETDRYPAVKPENETK